ncbi:hypothetical protein GGR58DRAFT_505031 [Xylaria digitata]|nr:hypothetical protein GGR58DRAFT_505031 [Xylaria digitata]
MYTSQHSQGIQREVLRSRYEDQDLTMYRAQGTKGSISDLRTCDVDSSLHDSPVHSERNYRLSHVLGYSSPRSQREVSALYRNPDAHESKSLAGLAPLDKKRPRGRKSKTQNEMSQVQRSWVQTPTLSRPNMPGSLGPVKLSSSQVMLEKTVKFGDKAYLDAGSPERHRRDTRRGQSEDYLARDPGNGDIASDLRYSSGYNKTPPTSLQAGVRQRGYLPLAPVIPRLPTPDFEPVSHYDILVKYDFCPCCSSDDKDEEEGTRWKKGKAKMDKQVDHARAYISRTMMSERLLR